MDKTFEEFRAWIWMRCGRAKYSSWEISWMYTRSWPFRAKPAQCFFIVRPDGDYRLAKNLGGCLSWVEAYYLHENKNQPIAWVDNEGFVMHMAYSSRFDRQMDKALGFVG